MCAIFGSIGYSLNEVNLEGIFRALAHRGPDDCGHSYHEASGILLGHTRLSIHDLTQAGHQPMSSISGRYEIVFNGEIYNYEELKMELPQGCYHFKSDSDTEVILALFEEYGVLSAVEKFVGMFAFIVYDKEQNKIFLSRDRIGEKPLYLYKGNNKFIWGSSLEVLKHYPSVDRIVSNSSLASFLRYKYIPGNDSIYDNVSKIDPGTVLTLELEGGLCKTSVHTYWSVNEQSGSSMLEFDSDQEAVESLESLLVRSVKMQMQADVPLGAFLSGGYDSSLIVALMQQLSNRPIRTYSMGFSDTRYDESRYARDVAQYLKTDHTEYIVDERDLIDVVPNMANIYDEPFADSSAIPTYMISQIAKRDVTVALSGDGGDELFLGYNRYFSTEKKFNHYTGKKLSAVGHAIKELPLGLREWIARLSGDRLTSRKIKALGELLSCECKASFYNCCVSNNLDVNDFMLQGGELDGNRVEFNYFRQNFPRDYSLTDIITYLPGDILTKVDRASMAVSLETRIPFLDKNVVEFSLNLPDKYKYRDGQSKWILKEIAHQKIPKNLLDRPKKGFGVPLDKWLRGPLRDWAEDLLSGESISKDGYFNCKLVHGLWDRHLQGANKSSQLWPILMFNQWLSQSR